MVKLIGVRLEFAFSGVLAILVSLASSGLYLSWLNGHLGFGCLRDLAVLVEFGGLALCVG